MVCQYLLSYSRIAICSEASRQLFASFIVSDTHAQDLGTSEIHLFCEFWIHQFWQK